jgi:hypothetical protein
MICQTCQGDGRRLNPGLRVSVIHDSVEIHNGPGMPLLVECPECRGSGKANGTEPSQRMRLTIEDVDGLISEVWACQPMLKAKRASLLNRLARVRHNLEILRGGHDRL